MRLSRKGHHMPRERLTPPGTQYLQAGWPVQPQSTDPADPETSTAVDMPVLHVNWSKNQNSPDGKETAPGFVQVSMQVDIKHLTELQKHDNEGIVATWLYTDSLDRETINRMIRSLRHARDSAYGIDE